MAALGDVGLSFGSEEGGHIINFSTLTLEVQPTGNGPIINAAPFIASPGSIINLNGQRGAQMDRVAEADGTGIWAFYDLSPGIYYATEAGVSRQWLIEVFDDLSWLVTPVTSGFATNASSISVG